MRLAPKARAALKTTFINSYRKTTNLRYSHAVAHLLNKFTGTKARPGNSVKELVSMSSREIEFLKLACTELTYKDIAERMNLSSHTIDGYRDALFEKLNVKSRIGLVLYAIRNKIVMVE